MNSVEQHALRYVRNTGGNATKEHFIDDHAPIGDVLWSKLYNQGLIAINSANHIVLTDKGNAALEDKT